MSIQLVQIDETLMMGEGINKKIPPVISLGWIAGGAIRRWFVGGERLSDIDVFFKNEKSMQDYIGLLTGQGAQKLSEHKNVITYSYHDYLIQCIRIKYYEKVEDLLDSFDFTVCQFAYDGFKVFSTPEAIISVTRKHLGMHGISKEFAVDSLRRAFKYAKKGYYPCNGTIQKLADSLRGLTAEEVKNAVEISPGGGKRLIRMD